MIKLNIATRSVKLHTYAIIELKCGTESFICTTLTIR